METGYENLQDASPEAIKQLLEEQEAKEAQGEQTPPQAESKEPQEKEPEVTENPLEDAKVPLVPEPTPEEQLILGKFKTPEEAYKAYQELEKMSTKNSQLVSHYKDTLSPYVDFDQEGHVANTKQQFQPQNQPQGQTEEQVMSEWDSLYNGWVEQHGQARASVMLHTALNQRMMEQNMAPVNELKAENSIDRQMQGMKGSEYFSMLESEITVEVKKLNTKARQNPEAVKTIYDMLLGRKLNEIVEIQLKERLAKKDAIEQQKDKAQVEESSKTPEEPPVDIQTLSASEMERKLGLKRHDRY